MPQRRRAFWAIAALLVIAATAVPALGEDAALSEDDSEHLEEEKAFLIVRKSATPKETVVGSNMTVVIEVHNAGSSSAYDVDLQDIAPPTASFTLLSGSFSVRFARINAGVTERHTYSLTPKAPGLHRGVPATLTYKADSPSSTEHQVAYSTDCKFVVLSLGQNYQRFFLKLGRMASLGLVTTGWAWIQLIGVLGLVGGSVGGHWAYTTITDTRKRRRYQRALSDVAKMK